MLHKQKCVYPNKELFKILQLTLQSNATVIHLIFLDVDLALFKKYILEPWIYQSKLKIGTILQLLSSIRRTNDAEDGSLLQTPD